MTRVCGDCEVEKPLDAFPKHKRRPLGRGYVCRVCATARTRAWYDNNKERAKQTGKRWRESNRKKQRASSRRHYAANAERLRERSRELNKRPEAKRKSRAGWLKRKYKISEQDWLYLFSIQQGACAICRSPDPRSKRGWHTDHDHRTGKVRGILCHSCNVMLGGARDCIAILDAAKAYLKPC